MATESLRASEQRWKKLEKLQDHFTNFIDFLNHGFEFLGFDEASDVQADIAQFLQYGPDKIMIQAQRGEAKTTITALFAVWVIIHNPNYRVTIVSASGDIAKDISYLIIKIINTMDILECLRPDTSQGDRSSVEGFDIHYSLKGTDRSASIACVGVTGTMTSRRSDILIADDIESSKNAETQTMRDKLLNATREFTSLCIDGRIIYLGTPQSMDSIYNTLPSRGFTVRIWPGRYPTPEQMDVYGENLAPYIKKKILMDPTLQTGGGYDGTQGKPTDERLHEDIQQEKELDQGTSYYQLQYMLNTALSDKNRFPLKLGQIICMEDPGKKLPSMVSRDPRPSQKVEFTINSMSYQMAGCLIENDVQMKEPTLTILFLDPAGGGKNADETGYCVASLLNSTIYIREVGGFKGGYDQETLLKIANKALDYEVNSVIIEDNFGHGSFREIITPIILQTHKCGIEGVRVGSKQKEVRISSILEPMIGRGSIVFMKNLIEHDQLTTAHYPHQDRNSYSLFFQISRLTNERECLAHDDRLDALAGACDYFKQHMTIDKLKESERLHKEQVTKFIKNPMGYTDNKQKRSGILNRFLKRSK